jgi:DNA end-binding protein Ku
VLLRETLQKTGRIGIARVVIRTREYLAAVMPQDDALMLILLRYPQEMVPADEYALPDKPAAEYRISERELDMASELIESMSGEWKPSEYRDEFREKLSKAIEKRLASKGVTATVNEDEEVAADATTNVVDFMALLKKSIDSKQRTPAAADKKDTSAAAKAERAVVKKPAAKKAAAKAPAKTSKKAPAKTAKKPAATRAGKGRKAG